MRLRFRRHLQKDEGIRSFEKYAEGFGIKHFTCDGADFFDTYEKTCQAVEYVQKEQKPILFHVVNLRASMLTLRRQTISLT